MFPFKDLNNGSLFKAPPLCHFIILVKIPELPVNAFLGTACGLRFIQPYVLTIQNIKQEKEKYVS